MRWLLTMSAGWLLLVAASPAHSGEKAKFEDVVKEMLATLDKITTTLAAIKDEKSAEASREPLKKAGQQFVELRKKADAMRPPSKEERDRLDKEFRPKLVEATKKVLAEIARVRQVPGGREALAEISAVIDPSPPKKK